MDAIATKIPQAIVAGDVKSLRRRMLLNNIRLGAQVVYFDIQNVKGQWYAWYFDDATNVINEAETTQIKRVK